MDASSAAEFPRSLELPPWKSVIGHLAALAVAIIFISAGVWKITQPFMWQTMVEELKVPFQFSLPLTIALGVLETFAGVTVLVPRFRRWGGWLSAALLVAFMIYIGANYSTLIGKDCSCIPWLKRTVGPGFFVGDAVMLAAALLAAWWSRPVESIRSAAVILGVVAVFSAVSFGSALTHQSGIKAPDSITVQGQPFFLQHGKIWVFFFDPHCSHCEAAAEDMGKLHWKDDVKVIGIATVDPRFAEGFLSDTKFKAATSPDLDLMRKTFPFPNAPYGVAIENGRAKAMLAPTQFEGTEPDATLRKLGYVE